MQECIISNDPELTELMNTIRENEDMGATEIKTFIGEDLRNNLNVVIEESDYLSQSKAAETDRVGGLLQAQILTQQDLEDPYVKLQLMRKLGMSQMPMADKTDIEKAERLVQYMESGDVQKAKSLLSIRDNKSLQLRVWSEWMKTSRYESLPEQIKFGANELVKSVEMELIAAQQKQQMQARQVPPPTRGAGGTPSAGGMPQ